MRKIISLASKQPGKSGTEQFVPPSPACFLPCWLWKPADNNQDSYPSTPNCCISIKYSNFLIQTVSPLCCSLASSSKQAMISLSILMHNSWPDLSIKCPPAELENRTASHNCNKIKVKQIKKRHKTIINSAEKPGSSLYQLSPGSSYSINLQQRKNKIAELHHQLNYDSLLLFFAILV